MYKIHYVLRMCTEIFHKMLKINDLRAFLRPFLGGWLGGFAVRGAFPAAICLAICACGGDASRGASGTGKPGSGWACADSAVFSPMEYSRMLRMGKACGADVAEIRSVVGRDTLVKRFVLLDSAAHAAGSAGVVADGAWKGSIVLRVPISRAVVLSSAQIGFMLRLGVEDRIVGVGAGAYIVDSALAAKVSQGEVLEVGNGPQVSLEKVVSLRPDLVMTFATGGAYDDYDRLSTLEIPLMLSSGWRRVRGRFPQATARNFPAWRRRKPTRCLLAGRTARA